MRANNNFSNAPVSSLHVWHDDICVGLGGALAAALIEGLAASINLPVVDSFTARALC